MPSKKQRLRGVTAEPFSYSLAHRIIGAIRQTTPPFASNPTIMTFGAPVNKIFVLPKIFCRGREKLARQV